MSIREIPMFIDGQAVPSQSQEWRDVVNPATQEVVARVPFCTAEEVDRAVASAKEAFKTWRKTPLGKRMRIMLKLQALIREHTDELAALITEEHGKTLPDAVGEVGRGLEVVEHACSITSLQLGELAENAASEVDVYTLNQPLGVGAGITAFNFPIMLPCFMFPLAIATGNTFVLKPSEQDPTSTMRLVELAHEAGIPAGVLNVVHGGPDVANQIADHQDIKALSFIGSTHVGSLLYNRAAAAGKRMQSMMGAKNHCVIMPDANRSQAINNLLGSAYGAAGQRCMANSVVVLVGEAREWLEDIVEGTRSMKVGPGTQTDADLGPLVSPSQGTRGAPDQRWREGRRQAAGRRPRLPGRRLPERQLRWPDPIRRRDPGDEHLPRGDLRPGAVRGERRDPGRGDRIHQRQPQRQRHLDLHQLRLGGAPLRDRHRHRPDWHQRADPGAGGLLQLHRIAGVQAR